MRGIDHFSFLSADIAVVEMSDAFRQPSLFYHLGVRESFSMANNIILYCDTNAESLQSLKVALIRKMGCLVVGGRKSQLVQLLKWVVCLHRKYRRHWCFTKVKQKCSEAWET